jgi:hypothetical protein
MYRIVRCSPKLRALFSKLGSLLLLFQRAPLIKMLFPEARVLAGAGIGELTKWTVAAYAGLSAYDGVAGATTITQVLPTQGATTVNTAQGSSLQFLFQVSGTASTAGSWSVSGPLPQGLTLGSGANSFTDSITGTPTQTGNFPITITAWEFANHSGIPFSKAFTIAVGAPVIATQPASTSIQSGATTTLTVVGSGTPLTYQWYKGTSPSTTNLITGATSSSFTTPALTANTSYWVKVSRSGVVANSTTATVTILPAGTAPAITTQPASTTISSGTSTTLTVAVSGTSPTFQWYQGTAGVTTDPVAGATSASFVTPLLSATTSYWVRASNGIGTADSSAAVVTVGDAPAITTQPAATSIVSGASATLTVDASGTSPTFQWYEGTSGVTTSPVPGATSTKLITPALTATTSFWARATNILGTADSDAAVVTVTPVDPFVSWQANQFNADQLTHPEISGPDADPDGDGVKNSDEYVFGTLPLTSDSQFMTITAPDTHVSVAFTAKLATGPGYEGKTRHYAIDTRPDLTTGDWIAITGFDDIVGADQAVDYTVPRLHAQTFYRVRVWLTP